jgi:hypothetical protein
METSEGLLGKSRRTCFTLSPNLEIERKISLSRIRYESVREILKNPTISLTQPLTTGQFFLSFFRRGNFCWQLWVTIKLAQIELKYY